ncbi:MAG: hypoxanthine phosphoribosyltransferase [Proteobacteria bacterium]|nr:hypoxanthine phosphoribosyltransferase [Pseudomonadota bacterium]
MSALDRKLKFKPLQDEQAIRARIQELGEHITKDLAGETVIVVGVLKGAFMFTADLVRAIKSPVIVDFIGCASYSGTQSTGTVRITHDLSTDIAGQNVLLVEDIVDTGRTIDYLLRILKERAPKSLKVCALLNKPEAREVQVQVDYHGFSIANQFVIGYGLDLDQKYRELPYIAQVL